MKFSNISLQLFLATTTLSCCNAFDISSFLTKGLTSSSSSPQSALKAFWTSSSAAVPEIQDDLTFEKPDMSSIVEEACINAASKMRRVPVPVSKSISNTGYAGISYVHWPKEQGNSGSSIFSKNKDLPPLVLIHGFDSSSLEYRRLGPQLAAQGIDVYAVDLLGWGYTQLDDINDFSANAKVEALESFVKTILGDNAQICIAGASLGGAAAIELASSNPTMCSGGLILLDAQGFVDGVGPMAMLPKPIAQLGVQVLKSVPLRSSANQMSYYDKETYATDDALAIGRLHCLRDGWNDALVNFMLSGGFSPSKKVSKISSPSLILWGRQDTILDGEEFAYKFVETLPSGVGQLQWIEECGHVPHLEQPEITASTIANFLTTAAAKESSSNSESTITDNNNKERTNNDDEMIGLPSTEVLAIGGLASIGVAILGSVASNL